MTVKEVADLVGISIRTLHYYDEVGLLTPDETTESGYRLYSDENLEALQQILFFKELGFSLQKIKEIIYSPSFDRTDALNVQRKMLIEKRNRIEKMINMIDKTILHSKGEITLTNKEKFEGFDFSHNPYEEEARKRWGDQAVDEYKKKIAQNNPEHLSKQWDALFRELADLREKSPESKEVQTAISQWYTFLNNNFGTYSFEAFKGLGEMYVHDERFTKNIDQYGDGLAKFMSAAMAIFANKNR